MEKFSKPNINRLKANNLSDKVIEELIAKHKKIKHKLESLTGAKLCREVKSLARPYPPMPYKYYFLMEDRQRVHLKKRSFKKEYDSILPQIPNWLKKDFLKKPFKSKSSKVSPLEIEIIKNLIKISKFKSEKLSLIKEVFKNPTK